MAITRLFELSRDDLQPLLVESRQPGFEFVDRLINDYDSGSNRFDRPGEALFAANDNGRLIAIGGLNRDPYATDESTGRVRHLYVLSQYRRQGVGAALMARIIAEARQGFQRITLRTLTVDTDQFYRALGFSTVTQVEGATHLLDLTADPYDRPGSAGACQVLLVEPGDAAKTGHAGGDMTAPSILWIFCRPYRARQPSMFVARDS